MSANGLLSAIVVFSLLAFILESLAFALPGWLSYENTVENKTVKAFLGLWLDCPTGWGSCVSRFENRTVTVHDAADITLWVTQSYGVLGTLLAIVCGLVGCCMENITIPGLATSVFNIGAGFSILIGLVSHGVVFEEVYQLQSDGANVYYCFWVALAACVLALFGGLLGLCSPGRSYKYQQ